MEPVFAICALTLFTWAVAIWATYGSDPEDHEERGPKQEEKPQERQSGDNRKAA